jgi:hypothetical protein
MLKISSIDLLSCRQVPLEWQNETTRRYSFDDPFCRRGRSLDYDMPKGTQRELLGCYAIMSMHTKVGDKEDREKQHQKTIVDHVIRKEYLC